MSEDNPALAFREAILACRAEQWRHGLELLTRVAQIAEHRGNLPGAFYSYLGLAMARVEGRKQEGMQLCRHALETQPGEADNHLNLATLYLFLGRRHSAFVLIERARRWFPDNARVAALHERLGIRKPSVFRFMSRKNPLNVLAGRFRHWWILQFNQAKAKQEEQMDLSDDTAEDM